MAAARIGDVEAHRDPDGQPIRLRMRTAKYKGVIKPVKVVLPSERIAFAPLRSAQLVKFSS
jgi:hypothetical protein